MKKTFIISAVILIALALALCLGALITSGFDFSKFYTAKYETNTYSLEKDFDKIEINTKEADVLLKPSENGEAVVTCVEHQKAKHEVYVENGTLKIRADDKREWYERINFFSKDLPVTVYLPADYYEALNISGHTGDVRIPATFSFGSVDVKLSTGDVFCDASSKGLFQIKTSTGDIKVNNVSGEDVSLTVSTGGIYAASVTCKETVSVNVSTGKANLKDITCKSLYSKGSTGDITLKNAVASDTFNIQRGTGDVYFENCDAGQIFVKTSTGDVTGTLLTEKVFITKTSTGSVSVPDTVSGGKCEIKTSTGDIDIRLSGS